MGWDNEGCSESFWEIKQDTPNHNEPNFSPPESDNPREVQSPERNYAFAGTVTHIREGWNPVTRNHDSNENDMIQGVTKDGELIYGYYDPNHIPDFGQFLYDPTPTIGCPPYYRIIKGRKYKEVKILSPIWANSNEETHLSERHFLHGVISENGPSRGEVVLVNPGSNFPKTQQTRIFFKSQLVSPCNLEIGTEVVVATSIYRHSKKVKIISILPKDEEDLELVKHDLAPAHKEKLPTLHSTSVDLFVGGAPDHKHPTFPTSSITRLEEKLAPGVSLIEGIIQQTLQTLNEEPPTPLNEKDLEERKKTATRFRNRVKMSLNIIINPLDFWDITEDRWAKEIYSILSKTQTKFKINKIFLLKRIDDGAEYANIEHISSIAKWVTPGEKNFLSSVYLPQVPMSLASYFQGEPNYRSDSRFNLSLLEFEINGGNVNPQFHSLPLERHEEESNSVFQDIRDYVDLDEDFILLTRPSKISTHTSLAFDRLPIETSEERPTSNLYLSNFVLKPLGERKGPELIKEIEKLGKLGIKKIGKNEVPYNPFYLFPAKDFFQPTPNTLSKQITIVFRDQPNLPIIEMLARAEGGPRPYMHPIAFSPKEVRVQCTDENQLSILIKTLANSPVCDTGVVCFYQKASQLTWLTHNPHNLSSPRQQRRRSALPHSPQRKPGYGYLKGVPPLAKQSSIARILEAFGAKVDESDTYSGWVKLQKARPLLKVKVECEFTFYQKKPLFLPKLGIKIETATQPDDADIIPNPPRSGKSNLEYLLSQGDGTPISENIPAHLLGPLKKLRDMHITPGNFSDEEDSENIWTEAQSGRRKKTKRGKRARPNPTKVSNKGKKPKSNPAQESKCEELVISSESDSACSPLPSQNSKRKKKAYSNLLPISTDTKPGARKPEKTKPKPTPPSDSESDPDSESSDSDDSGSESADGYSPLSPNRFASLADLNSDSSESETELADNSKEQGKTCIEMEERDQGGKSKICIHEEQERKVVGKREEESEEGIVVGKKGKRMNGKVIDIDELFELAEKEEKEAEKRKETRKSKVSTKRKKSNKKQKTSQKERDTGRSGEAKGKLGLENNLKEGHKSKGVRSQNKQERNNELTLTTPAKDSTIATNKPKPNPNTQSSILSHFSSPSPNTGNNIVIPEATNSAASAVEVTSSRKSARLKKKNSKAKQDKGRNPPNTHGVDTDTNEGL